MITQWDIVSNIRPSDNAILYALLIDGTEHDARLIAKKLKGYVRQPQPAMAPYVYSFPLPEDLDENTLEKIRVAVREGIEQAKKVNEFIPGGALGNPLFNPQSQQEDKDFPTFITLDPSESFFRSAPNAANSNTAPLPPVDHLERKHIDLGNVEEEIPHIAKTLEEIDKEGYRSDPDQAAPADFPAQDDILRQEELPAENDAKNTAAPDTEEMDLSPEKDFIPTSIESDENWPDDPPVSEQAPQAAPAAADAKEDSPLHIEAQTISAEDMGQGMDSSTRVSSSNRETAQPADAPSAEELPFSDRDMLIKDADGALIGESLDDIFLAETKYDVFMDVKAPSLSKEKTQGSLDSQKGNEPIAPKEEKTAPAADAVPPASFPTPSAERPEQEENEFNIFDQKIKDQTSFIDVDEVQDITERITQKDLEFLKHTHVPPAQQPPTQKTGPSAPAAATSRPHTSRPSAFRFDVPEESQEEVMDPFEQLLTAAQPDAQHADTRPETTIQSAAPAAPDGQELDLPAPAAPEAPAAPSETAQTPPPAGNMPAAQAVSNRENDMSENQGEKKPTLHIKRKITPQPPQAPGRTPPAIPAAPAAPNKPAAASPSIPSGIPPQQPTAAAQQPQPPEPEEEKHGTTILRRRKQAATFLEKTRTIDHSIELPLSELKKHNWPLEVPLIPTYTLENMTISVNRFAHATAISVIDNPGKLYNPLVLHGASGTGKTHFLHAIGYALSNKYGQENIFITNGVRLSRGIQRYVMEGNIDKFEKFTNSIKALLIDDIHLFAINEQNRAHLSKLLNDFLKQQKQIVITSKYPPESLAKLEELLNFRLDSGWISELKSASGNARTRIIQKMLNSNNIDITNDDITRFFGQANMSLGTVSRSIRRVRVLEKLIFPTEVQAQRSTTAIFEQLLATTGEDQTSLIAQKSPSEITSATVEGKGEWGRIGFFYPQNHSNLMNWLVFALQQRAKELGIPGGPELAVRSSYSTENIISSAFKIANLCDNKKLKGAVILGPEITVCDPSVRENFYDILTHMLEIMLIRCGVINYEDASSPSTYVKILSELLR